MKKTTKKKRPGRPPQNIIRLPAASVEEVADRIFANAKKPDPSIRIPQPTGRLSAPARLIYLGFPLQRSDLMYRPYRDYDDYQDRRPRHRGYDREFEALDRDRERREELAAFDEWRERRDWQEFQAWRRGRR